ncbi:MAG: LytTR family DNA-binding domain-containing protein [Lachnospiraceae bacterium]|nr:LytTR family DNA-binding domain-containing protein [Lachnospiraceae bacterium]
MNLSIAICDDDEEILKNIEVILTPYIYNSIHEITFETFNSSSSLIDSVKTNSPYDIYFLDIELADANGINIAKELRNNRSEDSYIIFISNYPEYMLDSFAVHPYYYIKKPIDSDLIYKLLDEIVSNKISQLNSFTIINDDSKCIPVNIHDIIYFETERNKNQSRVRFHLNSKDELSCKGTIREWQDLLKEFSFFECHKGIIVNIEYIHYIERDTITLLNGTKLPISRRRQKYVKEQLVNMINKFYK